jgi:squalene-hopene/tetraprenyl-beta-curcumene cyclase
LAKALDALGIAEVTTPDGVKHDWRVEMTRALTNRQKPDGSWSGDIATWMETNADLCTAYALIALSHTKPVTK